jgi:hypothetical protein
MGNEVKQAIKSTELANIEIEGINMSDAPDFVDAYVSYAEWADTGVALSEQELEALPADLVYYYVTKEVYGA